MYRLPTTASWLRRHAVISASVTALIAAAAVSPAAATEPTPTPVVSQAATAPTQSTASSSAASKRHLVGVSVFSESGQWIKNARLTVRTTNRALKHS